MKTFVVASLSVALFGCSSNAIVKTYSDRELSYEDIGVLKGNAAIPGDYQVSVESYAKVSPNEKLAYHTVGGALRGWPREVHMAPAYYVVVARCNGPGGTYYPQLTVDVQAGKTYEIKCDGAKVERNIQARAYISAEYASHAAYAQK